MAASILIVDDDAVARRLVENMVQKCGYETLVVESGDAAIAMLTAPDAPAIDAVVLDLVMPGLDGMGVLAKIREAGLNIPVIVQTAHGGCAAHRAKGSQLDNSGAGRRRIRCRQGIVRARHPWQRRTQIKTVRCGQLRRDPG